MLTSRSRAARQLRKQLLLVESELNRLALGESLDRVRHHTRWLHDAVNLAGGGGGSWISSVAPVAGMLAAGSLTGGAGWLGRGFKLLKLAAVVYPLWKSFTGRRTRGETGP
jgi:hypothetical protein